jgi:hypothetical protein
MHHSEEKKEFIKLIGDKLQKAYQRSGFKSYKQLTRAAAEHGYKFSPELMARYFSGTIEPGIFAFRGILAALNMSADQVLFDDSRDHWVEKKRDFIDDVSDKLRSSLKDSGMLNAMQIVVIAENSGYPLDADLTEDSLAGRREPGIFEFAGVLRVLGLSADDVLFGTKTPVRSGILLKSTADKLVDLLSGSADDRYRELNELYADASESVQMAVLELLRASKK